MTWVERHSESELLASEAHGHLQRGDRDRAIELFSAAAKAEEAALAALDLSKSRTMGITAVSAASLWYKADQFEAAERVALCQLATGRMPPFAAEQLRSLLQAVWTQIAMRAAGISFLPGQVTISVKGGQVISGGAPLDLIVEKVQTVQALFFRTIEFLKGMPHRNRGAPRIEIQEACTPWILQALPGSYQFAVAVQEPAQKDFFQDAAPDADQVAHHFLEILRASGDDAPEKLDALVPSPEYRKTFLKLTRNLAPTGKKFSRIEITGTDDPVPVVLGPEQRQVINGTLRNAAPKVPSVESREVTLRGVLRGLHLERDWLEVIVEGNVVHIDDLSEAVDDVIGPMVNRNVVVRALELANGKLRFIDLESAD